MRAGWREGWLFCVGELSRVPKLTLTEAHEDGGKSAVNLFIFIKSHL